MTQEIQVIVPPPVVIDVIPPYTPETPAPPIIIGTGQGGARGPQGPQGVQGVQGIQGPQGQGDQRPISYVHDQGMPSNTWTIQHNLGFYPNVTVVDSSGTVVEGAPDYVDSNTLILTFSAGFSGLAYLS